MGCICYVGLRLRSNVMFLLNAILVVVITLGLSLFHKVLLHNYGSIYITGSGIVLFLLGGTFLSALLGVAMVIVNYSGQAKEVALICFIVMIISLIGFAIFIPVFGMVGAAVMRVVSLTLVYAYVAYVMKRKMKLKPFIIY